MDLIARLARISLGPNMDACIRPETKQVGELDVAFDVDDEEHAGKEEVLAREVESTLEIAAEVLGDGLMRTYTVREPQAIPDVTVPAHKYVITVRTYSVGGGRSEEKKEPYEDVRAADDEFPELMLS